MSYYKMIGQTLSNTKLSAIYNNMIQRAINAHIHDIKPWYDGVTVSPLWYDPALKGVKQAENAPMHACYDWIREHYYRIDGEPQNVQLDKDIKVKGNRMYSPETCLFVPAPINNLFRSIGNPITEQDGIYTVHMFHKDIPTDTKDKALKIWNDCKGYLEERRNTYLEVYYGKVPEEVYNAIQAYEF